MKNYDASHAHQCSPLFPRICLLCGIVFEPAPQAETPEQFAQRLDEARERGLDGEHRAAEHANRVDSGWVASAVAVVCAHAPRMSGAFTFEELRRQVEGMLSAPPDLRAWGQVARRAIAEKAIIKTGRTAPRASGNCTPTMLYVSGELTGLQATIDRMQP